MTPTEKADFIMSRIQRVYETYTEDTAELLESLNLSDHEYQLVADAVLVEHNFDNIAALYELDPIAFLEKYGDSEIEDIEILVGWLFADQCNS